MGEILMKKTEDHHNVKKLWNHLSLAAEGDEWLIYSRQTLESKCFLSLRLVLPPAAVRGSFPQQYKE